MRKEGVGRGLSILVVAASLTVASAAPAGAQERLNVISANPFGLLLEFFNAEYERVVTGSSTAGFGGSFIARDDVDYFNGDVFWRFYPGGNPLQGWTFGTKVGLTRVEGGTFFGFGFDTNWSWLLGANDNFYVGIGFGLKRLLGTGDEDVLGYIPTIRLVNVGLAF